MTSRSAHLLAMVALGMLVHSGPAFAQTTVDYDSDNDRLIDITSLAQLNAIRWDLNGDGAIDAGASTSDTTAYNAAFPNRVTTSSGRMGCPSGTCTGYELLNNLNFDTDGSGSVTSADTYPNWMPIGNYSATFKGDNKTISNLNINRGGQDYVGLFGRVSGNISGLGLKSVNVRGRHRVGGLVGNQVDGRILGCFVTGRVEGTGDYVGGLVGFSSGDNAVIAASYANAVVIGPRNIYEKVGGLVGRLYGKVIASYAIGPVTGRNFVAGLIGEFATVTTSSANYATGTVTVYDSRNIRGGLIALYFDFGGSVSSNNYWDTESSGLSSSARGTGKTTSALQSETDYDGIYATWNVDVDGRSGNDDPWTFGAADQYPVLKYAGMDTTAQFAMQPPGIPTSVTVTPQGDTLDVRWTAASYATGYKVQWKAGGQNYDASREGAATGTRYKIPNLTFGTTYTVRVIATKTGARDGRPSAEQTGTLVLLDSPTVMVAATVDTLTVTWNAVDHATGYKVQWKSGSATYPTADLASAATHGQATISGGSTTTYKISNVTAGTTYTIRVIATSTNVNIPDSDPSEEVMVTAATNKPTNVRVTPGHLQLLVRWTEATGATGYKIQWKSGQQAYNTSSRQETVSGGNTTTYTIENLTFGTPYTVRVLATLAGGTDSTPSDEVMGTPQGIDYDGDGDGLIDIETLAQLHAIRWDLNGDGAIDASASTSDTTTYNAAFPNRDTTSNIRMGCPSGTCTGYELLNNLDFDTDGSGSVTSADTYPNWTPIGGTYSTTFKGNNKTISNLHINRGGQDYVGLFSQVSGNISGLGLKSVNVRGRNRVGGLVGNQVGGRILSCYVTGRVEGTGNYVGGLVGYSHGNNTVIVASYANVEVIGSSRSASQAFGGLVGRLSATVIASYAIGPVTGRSQVAGLVGEFAARRTSSFRANYATGTVTPYDPDPRNTRGGLIAAYSNFGGSGASSDNYWDRESSGLSTSVGGTGKTTSALQSETDYNGIYATWNVDVDGRPGNDAPWTFGAADQYPVLKYAGMDTTAQYNLQPPGIPTSVTVTQKADTLDVRWTAASYATGYKVQWKSGTQSYDTASREGAATGTRYNIPNLSGGTTYTMRVIATKTGARDGRPSAEQTGEPLLGIPAVMVAAKVNTLTVTWNAVNGATGYKVQWKSGAETYPTADLASALRGQATIADGSATTYDISGLTAGTTYTIQVIATRTNVADSAPSAEQTGVPVLGSPAVMVAATVDTLTVTWNAVDDATGYKVQWKSGSETYPNADVALATHGQATITDGRTTTYKISGLTAGTTYTIQVIATRTNVADSAPSEEVMVTLATNKPTNVRVTPGPVQLLVAWTEATGATGYKVQWKSGGQSYNTSDRQETVSGMSTTTYTIENLTFGTTYTVRVTATLAGGTDSTPSDEVMGTPYAINYDSDGDGLIDIKTLAQLNAIRWDLNGDGVVADSDTTNYNAAFPNRDTTSNVRMGCPSGTCTGYELLNNLDFDENGDDQITQADATYWNSGAGWIPIGTYTGTFKGNNKTISNLYISYRYPSLRNNVGLFSIVSGDISGVGLLNVNVHATTAVGGLVGTQNGGRITGCYVTGFVEGGWYGVGGLVGRSLAGHIAACYSHATAKKWPSWVTSVLYEVGGLVGFLGSGASVTASYATGPVAGRVGSGTRSVTGGLVGQNAGTITASYATGTATAIGNSNNLTGGLFATGSGTGTDSYWDTESSSLSTSAGGTGQTTSALQSETDYDGIYANWNVDVDGRPGNDDPWTFGAADQYPVLKYAGMDTTVQFQRQEEVPQVTLVLSPASIAETGAVSTVTATLDRTASAATTITVSAEAVSPAVASAFTLSNAKTLTIAANATTSTGTVTITAVNDMTDAPDKRVTVSATVQGGNRASLLFAATLTITDDEAAPDVTLVLSPASISEAGGVSTVTATLSHASSAATTITVRPVANAYTVGSDSTITIAAGSTANATDTVVITSVNNTQDAPDRDVTVSVVARNAQGVGSVTEVTLTLEDDDAAPDVTLVLSPASISEAGGVSTVSATLTHPSSEATTITVRPVANAYTVGADSTITIAAGSTANAADTVALTAVDNDIDASDNAVTVQAAVENDHGEGNVQAVTLTITDDDEAAIDVSAVTSTTVRLETTESGRAATFTVTLATEPTGDVALSVVSSNTTEGTVSPSVLTFTPSDWNTAQTVTVTGQDDTPAAVDGNQNYTVTLSVNQTDTQDANYDALSDISVYLVNRDNDFGLDISALTGQATEAGASATFTVALLTQPSAAVTISVTSQDPSEGRVEPAVLTFTTSGWNTAQTVTVTGQDDTIDDGDIPWTVRLALSSDDTGYNALADDVPVTTTDDEDAPTVTLVLTPSSISENAEVSTVSATLSHPSSATTTITVSATPVSPATASDFTLSNADTLIIAATATTSTGTVTITAVDNSISSGNKMVTVSASSVGNSVGTGSVTDAPLTIIDDEVAQVTLVLSPASISEAGAVSTVTATLNRTVTAATTITVSAMAVSPAVSGDFTLSTTNTLTIAASVTTSTGTVTITAVNNTTDAPDKRVTVSATVAGGNGASLSSAVTLTITDDEAAPDVTLVLMPSSISENAEVSTVSATLSHPSSAITTITVSATPVSPATASDFTLSSADTLIIAATTTTSTGTVTITAVDNPDRADDKTVSVSATANNDQGATDPSPVTLTLTDDEPSANLDVDGDGRVRLFSDIILVIRYVLFFREEALLRGNVIEQSATRTTAQQIEPYLDILVNQNILDVDGDGDVRLFSDIILIIRYVLFFRNEALVRGNVIEQNATRTTAQEIEPYIRSLYPDSHFQ